MAGVDLPGARALVTGGASGIGAAIVEQLQAAGCRAATIDVRSSPRADLSVLGDISREDEVTAAIDQVHDAFGGLDLAVLNAGVGGFGALIDTDADEWDRVTGVNLRGAFLCLRESARVMVRQGTGGAIVVVSSVSGFLVDRMMGPYSVSKAGAVQLARVAARELGPFGITVNVVAPGTTDTPMFASTARLPGYQARVAERAALGGIGSAHAVASAVVSLARLEWVTGQVLAADGGVSLWSPIDPAESLGGAPRNDP